MDGKLTWKNVAAVAGVSKATADRAVDLRDDFRRQLRERMPPAAEHPGTATRRHSDLDEELARLRRENSELKRSTDALHAVVLALTQENQRLGRRHGGGHGNVVTLSGHQEDLQQPTEGRAPHLGGPAPPPADLA